MHPLSPNENNDNNRVEMIDVDTTDFLEVDEIDEVKGVKEKFVRDMVSLHWPKFEVFYRNMSFLWLQKPYTIDKTWIEFECQPLIHSVNSVENATKVSQ